MLIEQRMNRWLLPLQETAKLWISQQFGGFQSNQRWARPNGLGLGSVQKNSVRIFSAFVFCEPSAPLLAAASSPNSQNWVIPRPNNGSTIKLSFGEKR